ncbi:dynein axonemal intermediate chain 4 [Diretmus argenteus]
MSVFEEKQTTVFDDDGSDVTPQPLYQPEPGASQAKHSRGFLDEISTVTTTDFLSMFYQTGTTASFAWPFSRSVLGSTRESRSSQSTMESMNEEIEDTFSKRDIPISLPSYNVQVKREEVKEQVREDMLDVVVDVNISETETISLLDMPNIFVSVDAADVEAIRERNNHYAELCKNKMANAYKYVDRWMQTFNEAPKNKHVQSDEIVMVDAATSATTWDIYDSFYGLEQSETVLTPGPDKAGYPEAIMDTSRGPEKTMSVVSTASMDSLYSSQKEMETFGTGLDEEPDPQLILLSEKFHHSLLVMERSILGNLFQPKLAAYRQLPTLEDPDSMVKPEAVEQREEDVESSPTPALELLWAFRCELTRGHNVSRMAWNKKNPDLLAVGYGKFDFKNQKPGLVCCWSLKNPTWPERIFHCESGVTALDFSASNPNQLAVGMYDGTIAIYNVQSQDKKTPIMDSGECVNKHFSPIWQIKWTEQEMGLSREDKGEVVISISADGRISKWFLHNGLDCIDLMELKRTQSETSRKQVAGKEKKTEDFPSRLTTGLCFDFHPLDSSIYLAGTCEGLIYKCSCYNSQQFLETYRKHTGHVYQVTWSPFIPDVFLSCSSDWTIQLWKQDRSTPVLGFTSTQKAVVFDIMWSPKRAMMFGAITEGRVEIWDLRYSISDPIIVHLAAPGVKMTSLLFATQIDCVLVGDSDGQVSIYQLKNLTVGDGNQVDTVEEIISSAVARQL